MTTVIALDPGFGNTKVCLGGQTTVLQSAVSRPKSLCRAAVGMKSAQQVDKVTIDGQTFVIGAGTLRDHDIAVVVEGEFDALLLEQEAGDLVGVCTLGSASSRTLDGCWLSYLIHCQKFILVGDSDPAGQDWVRSMGSLSRRMCWTKFPAGKDITEFWRMGGDLKGWVEAILHQIRGECEREV